MRSVTGLSWVVSSVLAAACGLELLRLVSGAARIAGVAPAVTEPVYGGLTLLAMAVWLSALGAWAAFTWRSLQNVHTFSPDYAESTASATLGWLLPGWNLYKPYDALTGIWGQLAAHPVFEEPEPPGRLLELFWVCWVASIVIGRLFGGGSEDSLVGAADLVAAATALASGVAGVLVVRRLAALQERVAAA